MSIPIIEKRHILKSFPFKRPRYNQIEIIEQILRAWYVDGKRFVILIAPTGIGKSVIADTSINVVVSFEGTAHYIVSEKQLQAQIIRDFNYANVKGRNNFPCLKASIDCSEAQCVGTDYDCKHRPSKVFSSLKAFFSAKRGQLYWKDPKHCEYWSQKAKAINNPKALHNYAYFLTEINFAMDFGTREVMVCDECHDIEDQLMNFVSLSISTYQSKYGVNIRYEERVEKSPLYWYNRLSEIYHKALSILRQVAENFDTEKGISNVEGIIWTQKELTFFQNLILKIGMIANYVRRNPDDWVVSFDTQKDNKEYIKVIFRTIDVSIFGEQYLFKYGRKVLLMSATFSRKLANRLGINNDEIEIIDCDSPFPLENRIIYINCIGKMSKGNKAKTFPKMVAELEKILSIFPDVRGLIHTHSYSNAKFIIKNISPIYKKRLETHKNSSEKKDLLSFKHVNSNGVIVSPSMEKGVDLEGDLCRFNIVCKIPYMFLGDELIKKKMERDPDWYNERAVMDLIQMLGRGVRNETDHCSNFVLDSSFEKLLRHYKKSFPRWILSAMVRSASYSVPKKRRSKRKDKSKSGNLLSYLK